MKKKILLVIFLMAVLLRMNAQSELMIKAGDKYPYLEHKVAAKEGLYSIGRLYNVNPKFIALYNKMDMDKGLNIDQVIRIPLTDTNFTQKGNKGTPVYYLVSNGDGLLTVSNAAKKVPLQTLRDWNGLAADKIEVGSKLLVGFLNSKEMPAETISNPAKKEEVKAVVKAEPAIEKPVTKPAPVTEQPVVKIEPVVEKPIVKAEPAKEEAKPVVTEIVKKEEPVKTVAVPATPVVKEEVKAVAKVEPVVQKQEATSDADHGFFKSHFDQQVKAAPAIKNATVTAGIFKTASGWQDAKFYLLIDGAASGSIVKLVNPENSKVIYAKVLGEMNGIRQNEGLDMRISNAAAAALGIADTEKFILQINY
jgi:LysM repeat protein